MTTIRINVLWESTSVTGAVTRLGCLVLKSAPEAPDKRCPKNDDRSKCICSPISKTVAECRSQLEYQDFHLDD